MGNPWRPWRSRKGRVRSYEFRVRMGLAYLLVPVSLAGIIGLVALFQVGSAHGLLATSSGDELETLSTLRHDLHVAGELVEEYSSTGSPDAWAEYDAVSRSIESNLAFVAEFDEPEEVRLGTVATEAWDAGRRDAAYVFAGAPRLEVGARSRRRGAPQRGRRPHRCPRRGEPGRAAGDRGAVGVHQPRRRRSWRCSSGLWRRS